MEIRFDPTRINYKIINWGKALWKNNNSIQKRIRMLHNTGFYTIDFM